MSRLEEPSPRFPVHVRRPVRYGPTSLIFSIAGFESPSKGGCSSGLRMLRGLVAISVLLFTYVSASATEQRLLSYGRHLARECTSCHRLEGASNGIPSLAGFD